MNNLVWTSISKGIEDCLLDWIISLRKLAMYDGEVLILNYGAEPSVINFIKKYNVNIIDIDLDTTHNKYNRDINLNINKVKNSKYSFRKIFDKNNLNDIYIKNDLVVNYRYIDIIPILEEQYPNYNTAHFDVDMWFQDDISPLFNDIEKAKGCLFSPAGNSPADCNGGLDITSINIIKLCTNNIEKELDHKYNQIINLYGGHINGGFIAGKSNLVLDKFKEFRNKIETFEWPNIRGSNQAFLNYSFDIEKDDGSYFLYNIVPIKNSTTKLDINSNKWKYHSLKQTKIAKCIHAIDIKCHFYKFNNFETFWREINE